MEINYTIALAVVSRSMTQYSNLNVYVGHKVALYVFSSCYCFFHSLCKLIFAVYGKRYIRKSANGPTTRIIAYYCVNSTIDIKHL